jgi:DNA-binding transcriptional LysR family regulator
VRLGASTGAIAHLLPQALEGLRQHHPAIDIQVAVLTSHETLSRLADGTLDVGLVALPQPPVAGLVIKPWRRDPVMAFLPAHWECPARVTPEWLAAQPLILNDATTRLSRLTTEWFATAGYHPAPAFSSTTTTRSRVWWRPATAPRCSPGGDGAIARQAHRHASAAPGVVASARYCASCGVRGAFHATCA